MEEIEEIKERFVGALCNAGYCQTLLEAEQEVQDFVDKIAEKTGDSKEGGKDGKKK